MGSGVRTPIADARGEHAVVHDPEQEERCFVLFYSRPEGVAEMFATSFRVFFFAIAVFAILAVVFLVATA
ncbi:MAG TPA: hypothetical protein VLA22_09625 [Gaiellaceae bacterium]|nr:hypothetical protein [Gaiellaceae bacterium]